MYAIIEDSGSQIRVEEGQQVRVDYRSAQPGDKITFDKVLACIGDGEAKFGSPVLEGASVTGEVVRTTQGPKIVVQKFRRRKGYRRKTGHRQLYTEVKISKIKA